MKRRRWDRRWGKSWCKRRLARWGRLLIAFWTAVLMTVFGAGWIVEAASHEAGSAAGAGTGAASGSGTQIRVQVGHEGFKVLDGGALEARAGEQVEITFVYGDGDLGYDNPHQVYFPTLDMKSEILKGDHPESTVTFTATETGKIPLKCVQQCDGHKLLQDGFLTVGEAAAQARPSVLQVDGTQGKSGIELAAILRTQSGEPVKGARVFFQRAGSFFGVEGVKLGEALDR